MATKRYSARRKATALKLYEEVGPREASRRLKIPARTLTRWANRADVHVDTTKTAAATEAARVRTAEKRALLRERLLDQALDILERTNEPHEELKVVSDGRDVGSHVERVPLERPTAGAVRDYTVAVGILIDKLRLEGGEATSIAEVSHEDARAKLAGKLDQLAARRRAGQATGHPDRG